MFAKTRLISLLVINGFFLLADRFFKQQSTGQWASPHLLNKFFGWEPSLNSGLAFSLPAPNLLTIILTIPIILIIIYLFLKETEYLPKFALLMIVCGALSNLFDRIFFGHIFDYFLVLTAIINLADVMIALGFLLYLLQLKKNRVQ